MNDSTSSTNSVSYLANRFNGAGANTDFTLYSRHSSTQARYHAINGGGEGQYNWGMNGSDNLFYFSTDPLGNLTTDMAYVIDAFGNIGVSISSPTAQIHIQSQTVDASTAPIKFVVGPPMTTPEDGALEYVNTDVDNLAITVGSDRYILMKGQTTRATVDFPATANLAQSYLDIVVTGAQVNDRVIVQPNTNIDGTLYYGTVTAVNNVRVGLFNFSGAGVNPASQEYIVSVIH